MREVTETNEKAKSLKSPGLARDYIDVINRNITVSRQFYGDLFRNADEVSKLSDALPSDFRDLRNEREKTSGLVESIDKELTALFAKDSDLATRFLETQLAAEKTIKLDATIIKIGSKAMVAADETIEHQDRKIKALGIAVDILVPLAAVFGLVAAFWGVKLEGAE